MDALSAPDEARRFCLQVRELGFELALTHFGCSLDPFRILGQVQADYVKLDRSLLQHVNLDADQRERLHEVVSTLHAQGVRVIAPMVEEIEVLPLLWQSNVNFVQGNCLQQPSQSMEFGMFQEQTLSLESVG
jgi:EAL domain-containing protein (putative c-di-GMP-specific phosphodiesterase class I)